MYNDKDREAYMMQFILEVREPLRAAFHAYAEKRNLEPADYKLELKFTEMCQRDSVAAGYIVPSTINLRTGKLGDEDDDE